MLFNLLCIYTHHSHSVLSVAPYIYVQIHKRMKKKNKYSCTNEIASFYSILWLYVCRWVDVPVEVSTVRTNIGRSVKTSIIKRMNNNNSDIDSRISLFLLILLLFFFERFKIGCRACCCRSSVYLLKNSVGCVHTNTHIHYDVVVILNEA